MVRVSIPIVIEGEGPISSGFKVITPNATAWHALLIDGHKSTVDIAQDPYSARSRAIENEVVEFTAVLVINGEDSIGRGFEVVSANAVAWITLLVDGREIAIIVTQNPYSARARAVEDEMVKFTAVVVIEGKGAISCGSEVISTDANAWIALLKDGHESALVVAYNPYRASSRAIEHEVIKVCHCGCSRKRRRDQREI